MKLQYLFPFVNNAEKKTSNMGFAFHFSWKRALLTI